MPSAIIFDIQGKKVKDVSLPQQVFGAVFNADLVHQVVVAQQANARSPWAHTKTREDVRGGGKKPWKQKGTGRARHGSTRSPIWTGGGVTFGPRKDRNFTQKVNKKMKRKALCMMLSNKLQDGSFGIVDIMEVATPKTKMAHEALKSIVHNIFKVPAKKKMTGKKLLVVKAKKDAQLERAAKNVSWASLVEARNLNVFDILSYDYCVVDEPALAVIEKTFASVK
jgi:large subunit ribosomal protein L4